MKRSDALVPLSRDHHQALVVARDLRRATDESAADAAQRFVQFLSRHELAHFALEESVLLPVIGAEGQGEALARQMLEDHAFLRDALRQVRAAGAVPAPAALRRIGERLRDHVQMEERQLFPHLEEALSESALEQVGARVRASVELRQ